MTVAEMFYRLCEMGYAQAVDCLSSVNGFTKETAEDILYWATGYRDFEEEEEEEEVEQKCFACGKRP